MKREPTFQLERTILTELKQMLDNPKLKASDLFEWSSGHVDVPKGGKEYYLPGCGMRVSVRGLA